MVLTKGDGWTGKWAGRTVVCVASGPSLTVDDCDRVRASGHPTIVANTSFRRCLWADVLFAFDAKWWEAYRAEVDETFKGQRVTCCPGGVKLGAAELLLNKQWFTSFHNSGANAVSLAITGKAKRVLMIGYDCQKTGGMSHWHGDHPKVLSNVKSIDQWPTHFKNLSRLASAKGVQVINCSRETSLRCFPRAELEASL